MPNWVYNSVHIEGDHDKVAALQAKLAAPYKGVDNGAMNFLNLVAPPEEHWEAYANPKEQLLSAEAKNANKYNWYDWNCTHWGTKWNACDENYSDLQVLSNGQAMLGMHFETAWSPPTGIIQTLHELCVDQGLHLSWHWEEEQGFGEEYETDGENLVTVDEWDIPSSHAEHEARDKTCLCDYEEDPQYWYDDCPKTKESVEVAPPQEVGV